MNCIECGKLIGQYNWKYCSIKCRNKAVSKLPRRTYKRTNLVCEECGKIYLVVNSKKEKSHFCSRKCQGKMLSKIKNILRKHEEHITFYFYCSINRPDVYKLGSSTLP